MFSAIRKRLQITPATAIAFLALVFAISGVSYAATNGGTGNHKNALTAHTAKAKRGPRGPQGPAGKEGKEGKAGATGATGATGAPGAAGSAGAAGGSGESVSSAMLGKGEGGCKEGGSEFTVGEKATTACNGEEGEPGAPGEPGEAGAIHGQEPLPKGATETGTWTSQRARNVEVLSENSSISFPIQLPAPIATKHALYVTAAEQTSKSGANYSHCGGSVEKPKAEEGYLCLYQGYTTETTSGAEIPLQVYSIYNPDESEADGKGGAGSAGVTGALINIHFYTEEGSTEVQLQGTWAVTAE